MQEALRSGRLGDAEQVRIAEDFRARVRRLQSLDARFGAVKVSRHVEDLIPSVMTA